MTTKEKRKKKNVAGFFDYQLKLLLYYCHITRQDPKIPFSEIHRNYNLYSRRKSTIETIKNAIIRKVVWGPHLFTNGGIEASLIHDIDNPREFYKECIVNPKTSLVILSDGHWPIFWCKQGANTLQNYESILPNKGKVSNKKIEGIFFEEKETLPVDKYPHRWFEEHWNIYYSLKFPRIKSFRDAGKELGIDWQMARVLFKEILMQCKVITNFFPLGREQYNPSLVTLKTDYEIGLVNGLKTLNRTTYLYKTNNTIILYLFIRPLPKERNHFADRFHRLEEMGLISDLHISTPYKWKEAWI